MAESRPQFQPADLGGWREWLTEHHLSSPGIWLIAYKKGSGKSTFTFDEAVEEALCFGWIDSLPRKLDDERSMLYFAPRKAKTGWSRVNKDRIAKLIEAGKMTAAGTAKIEAAKADGSWNLLDEVEELLVPEDLVQAFSTYPGSRANFELFPRSAKRGILEWILQAKSPDTRQRRVEETARLAYENVRANQWPKK